MNWKKILLLLIIFLVAIITPIKAQGFYDFGFYDVFSDQDVFINSGVAYSNHNVAYFGKSDGSEYASYNFYVEDRWEMLGALGNRLSEKLSHELKSMRVNVIENLDGIKGYGLKANDAEKLTEEHVKNGFAKVIRIYIPITSSLNFAYGERGFLTSRIHLVVYRLQHCESMVVCYSLVLENNGDHTFTDWYYKNGGIIFTRTKEIMLQNADLSTLRWEILEKADELIKEFALDYLKAQRN